MTKVCVYNSNNVFPTEVRLNIVKICTAVKPLVMVSSDQNNKQKTQFELKISNLTEPSEGKGTFANPTSQT